MSNWKIFFKPLMVEKGIALYKKKAVKNYMKTTNSYKADVVDDINYHVTLDKTDGVITKATCSCAYSKNTGYCKHIASLLYSIEKTDGNIEVNLSEEKNADTPKKNTGNKNGKKYVTLPYNDDGKPHYLSLCDSLSVYQPQEKTYEKALELINGGKVKVDNISISEKNNNKLLTYVAHISDGKNDAEVRIILSKNGIEYIGCEDGRFWYSTYPLTKTCAIKDKNKDGIIELCTHKTAALILLLSYMEKNRDIVDYTDPTARSFIENFKTEKKSPIEFRLDNSSSYVDIEPTIETKRNKECVLTLRLLSTNGKYYKVRDISDLKCVVDNHWEFASGQNCYVDFSSQKLNERGKNVFLVYDAYIASRRHTTNYYSCNRDEINLIDIWDEFFDIMKDTPVMYNSSPLLGFKETEPSFKLKIDEIREREEIVGVKVSGNISGRYSSEKYLYYFKNGYLERVQKDKLGSALSFLPLADSKGNFSFNVGLSHIDTFYSRVLPDLRRHTKVEDNAIDSLDGKLKEPPLPVFYIYIENDIITCRPVFRYEGNEYRIYPRRSFFKREKEELKAYEADIADYLSDIFYGGYTDSGCWTVKDNDDDVYDFLHNGITILMEYGEVQVSEDIKKIIVRKMPFVTSTIDINENDDSILDFTLDLNGFTLEELVSILESYRNKKKFHRLKNGDFISLEEVNLDVLKDLFFSSGISIREFVDGKMHLPLYRALYLDQILQNREGLSLESGQRFKRLIKEFKTINESDYKVPSSLEDVLRSYQKDGYRWMRVLFEYGFGGILADDMGLGKTIQALSLLLSMKEEGKDVKTLIVSPSSLVYNWKAECTKFTPSLKAVAVAGNIKEREAILSSASSYDILITSYDLLKRDIALYGNIFFDVEIIDEAQYIKNHNTAQAKAVRAVNAKNRLALTGTPIENRLLELWSIFEYLMPGFLYNEETFKKNISSPIEKNGDKDAQDKLKKLTSPFILRRLKSDVLKDLPDKIEETRVTPLTGEQLKLYIAEVAKTKGMLKGEKNYNEHKIEILAELTRIRQICCDPSLIFTDYKGESAKRNAAIELIKSAIDGGHKILLFSQFTSMLSLLEEDLKKEGISYYTITGDTGKAKRLALVDSFNSDDTPLFLISLKAGGTGLNLTAADIVIHYDPWWNVAVQNQATDRAHRIGQTKRVTVYKMICENTIEEKIVKLQETKKNLADEIISADNMSLSSMTKDDLMELLDISSTN